MFGCSGMLSRRERTPERSGLGKKQSRKKQSREEAVPGGIGPGKKRPREEQVDKNRFYR